MTPLWEEILHSAQIAVYYEREDPDDETCEKPVYMKPTAKNEILALIKKSVIPEEREIYIREMRDRAKRDIKDESTLGAVLSFLDKEI